MAAEVTVVTKKKKKRVSNLRLTFLVESIFVVMLDPENHFQHFINVCSFIGIILGPVWEKGR